MSSSWFPEILFLDIVSFIAVLVSSEFIRLGIYKSNISITLRSDEFVFLDKHSIPYKATHTSTLQTADRATHVNGIKQLFKFFWSCRCRRIVLARSLSLVSFLVPMYSINTKTALWLFICVYRLYWTTVKHKNEQCLFLDRKKKKNNNNRNGHRDEAKERGCVCLSAYHYIVKICLNMNVWPI